MKIPLVWRLITLIGKNKENYTCIRAQSFLVSGYPFGYGSLAQLGERVAGSDEVSGSIPLGSTIFSKNYLQNVDNGIYPIGMSYLKNIIKTLTRADFSFYILPALMVLLVVGTVAQADMGLFRAHQMFFSSFVFFAWGFLPLPGGYMLVGALAVGLALKFFFYSEWSWVKAGIILTHFGALILLFGGLITAITTQEGFMIIPEGDQTPYVYDYNQRTLFVFRDEALLEQHGFSELKGALESGLPFEVVVSGACANCEISKREGEEDFRGMAEFMALSSKREALNPEENFSGVSFSVEGLDKEQDGVYIAFEGMPQPIEIADEDHVYKIIFGKQQRLLPFQISLVDFVREVYPGTDKPRDYHSDVLVKDGGLEWPVRIGMNEPLRYKGYTFYQSSFQQGEAMEATVLAVVRNKGQIFPYIGALVIALGLLLHVFLVMRRRV